MRLIDADALMQEFAEFVRDSNNSDFADVPTWNDAVSLLGSAPTIEPEPSQVARDIATIIENEQDMRVILKNGQDIRAVLKNAQPERKKGKWIPHREKSREYIGTTLIHVTYDYRLCDTCGYRVENGRPMYNFCPNCGADMREEQDGRSI